MTDFLSRLPFALLGAVGLISLADFAINLHQYVQQWVDVWQTITRPLWGLLFSYVDIIVPWYVADYMTLGLIVFGMELRSFIATDDRDPDDDDYFDNEDEDGRTRLPLLTYFRYAPGYTLALFLSPFIWPYFVFREIAQPSDQVWVFWETGVYALLLIAASYALIYAGI